MFSPDRVRQVLELSRAGISPQAFQRIRHLAIDQTYMWLPFVMDPWRNCHCRSFDCASRSKDPLPRFLALFPRLKSFQVAQASTCFSPDEKFIEDVEPVKLCECGRYERKIKHEWPIYKGLDDGARYISYVEDSDCPFPTLTQLAHDREMSRPGCQWPYYDSLRYLDMRILRRVTLDPSDKADRFYLHQRSAHRTNRAIPLSDQTC